MTPRVAVLLAAATGGTARHAGLLAEGCRRAGLPVLAAGPAATRPAFLAGAAALPADAVPPGDIPWRRIEIAARPRPVRDAVALAALRRLITAARPDVLHAHGLRAGALAALAAATLPAARRPALVVTVHNAPPPARAARAVHAVLELTCARRADAVLCASADLAARMRRRGAAGAQEFAVPAPPAAPPAPADVARARAALGPPGRPVVLAVGRLAPQKGLDILLAAAASWRHRDPVPVLAIAGEGPLAAALTAAARRDGTDLTLLGPRDDVPALLAAADVIAVPSRWEARALIVQEAMAAGRPIVASRVGGIPALTGEDAAILVPPGDPRQLAAAITAILDDPARAARLSQAARRRAATLPAPAAAITAILHIYAHTPNNHPHE